MPNSLFDEPLGDLTAQLCALLAALPLAERVTALNAVRAALHQVSPFQSEPVDCVQWVPAEQVRANDYNPNHVAPPELRLLERSITADGYTQPIVGMQTEAGIEVVDGAHRTRVGQERRAVRTRVHGYLPVALIRSASANAGDFGGGMRRGR